MPPLGACPSNANNFDLKAQHVRYDQTLRPQDIGPVNPKTEHSDRLVGIRGSLPRAMLRLIADQAAKNSAAFALLAPRRLPLTYARLYAEIQKHAHVLRAIGISRCSGSFCVRAEGSRSSWSLSRFGGMPSRPRSSSGASGSSALRAAAARSTWW